jgi:dTDP-glucose 4,6-dehydratase/UDP-glucuronate decarboxylase
LTVISLLELLEGDLETICRDASSELRALSGARLLVTGGGGFLGYYLVQAGLHWNRTRTGNPPIGIVVYDNYARGVPQWLEGLRGEPSLTLRQHDMTQPLPEDIGHFDYVIHAAGIASPTVYRAQPLLCIDANIVGLRNLLDYGVSRARAGNSINGMLFYSSSEIYGDPPSSEIPTDENYRGNVSCTGPRACYDESKRFGETLCVTFARHQDVPVRIARPFNNYGPGLKINDGRVIPDFARDVLAGRDLALLSDGSPTRTFCYATDAVAGYYKVLVRGRSGEAYNIGIEHPEISIAELAERIREQAANLLGYTGSVVRGRSAERDYLVDNPSRRCPSIFKARAELGYAPHVPLEEGLSRALTWYYHNRTDEKVA